MTDNYPTVLQTHLSNNFADVNPFLIFESVEKDLERISFRQVSAESLAAALKPYIKLENLSLDQFVDNVKYIRAAYLLGVRKFQPRFKDDTLALAIYESDNIPSNEKQQLFEWLLQENYFTTNPLPLKTIYKGLEYGTDLSFACLLKHFPIEESQIVGYYPIDINPSNLHKRNNILHAAVYDGGVLRMWKSLLRIYSTEELLQLLLETNKMNRSALFLITSNYFNHQNRMPKEILLAFIRIAQSNNVELIKEFYKIPTFTGSSVYSLMYKHGMTPDKVRPIRTEHNELLDSPFTIVHDAYRFKDEANKNFSLARSTSESTEGNLDSLDAFPIDTLLPELVWLIAEYLDIVGLVGLFTASKTMVRLMNKKDNRFWQQIYEQKVYPNKKVHNYKTMLIQYARSAPNWIHKNFNKIKLKKGLRASSLMDENWLVLLDDENIYLWDCHTHKVHWICSTGQNGQMHILEPTPLLILGGVYNGICPPILVQESGFGANARYYLAVGGEYTELQIDPALLQTDNDLRSVYQIDENMLLLLDKKLFDIQSRTIIEPTYHHQGQLHHHHHLIYNPFNHTYITLHVEKNHFEVHDMNHNLIRQFDATTFDNFTTFNCFVLDEFKLLLHDSAGHRDYLVIDFSSEEVVETKTFLTHSTMSHLILPCSLNRAILADDRTGLVTICHFPSMQWEAVYYLKASITAANSRYLVGNEGGSAVIYDFCK